MGRHGGLHGQLFVKAEGAVASPLQHKALSAPLLSHAAPAHETAAAAPSRCQPAAHVIVLHTAFSVADKACVTECVSD